MIDVHKRKEVHEYWRKKRCSIAALARRFGLSWASAKKFATGDSLSVRRERAPSPKLTKRRNRCTVLAKRIVTTQDGRQRPLFPSCRSISSTLGVHPSTVWRDLRKSGFSCRVRKRIPNADQSVWKKRLAFCSRFQIRQVPKLIFTDEHTLSLNDHTSRTMWVPPGSVPLPRERRRLHNTDRIMIWAGVGVGMRTPLVIISENGSKTMNKSLYIRRCLSPLISGWIKSNRILWQDGAKPHTSAVGYLRRKGMRYVSDVPPYSPDLNQVERVWKLLNARVAEKAPTSMAQLKSAARAAWAEIPQKTIDRSRMLRPPRNVCGLRHSSAIELCSEFKVS